MEDITLYIKQKHYHFSNLYQLTQSMALPVNIDSLKGNEENALTSHLSDQLLTLNERKYIKKQQ
jgi:hypothetical protein